MKGRGKVASWLLGGWTPLSLTLKIWGPKAWKFGTRKLDSVRLAGETASQRNKTSAIGKVWPSSLVYFGPVTKSYWPQFWPTYVKFFKRPYLGVWESLPQQNFIVRPTREWRYLTKPFLICGIPHPIFLWDENLKFAKNSVQIRLHLMWIHLKILHMAAGVILSRNRLTFWGTPH